MGGNGEESKQTPIIEGVLPANLPKDVELEGSTGALEAFLDSLGTPPFQRAVAFLIALFGLGLIAFHLLTSSFGAFEPFAYRSTHVSFVLLLIFLLYPTGRKSWKEKFHPFFLLDVIILAFLVYSQVYIYWDVVDLPMRAVNPNLHDLIVGTGIYLLVIEGARRAVGLPMALVAIFFSFHAIFAGHFPGIFSGNSISFERFIGIQFLESDGIYGIPVSVMALFVVLFIIYSSILSATRASRALVDLAIGLTGWMTGGPAKTSVVSSALFGTISGSAVANVVVDGIFTIPMMKKTGYSGEEAAGIEAVTSSGGQIMPPVMGATAFVMAGLLGMSYGQVCLRAAFPAILYYLSLFFVVHYIARRRGLKKIPRSELPSLGPTLKKGVTLISIAAVILFLILGFTADLAALWGIIGVFVLSFISRHNRISPLELLSCFIDAARLVCSVSVACACAGIIIGAVSYSGLGMQLTGLVLKLSQGYLWLALFLTMIVSIILGMGLTTTAVYITLAVLVIPGIIEMKVLPVAAHMFCFYFGVISNITPPVALAAFAAAGIAGTNPMRTGWEACKIGCVAFIIPYMFVYNPEILLIGAPLDVVLALATATIGAWALGCSVANFLILPNLVLERGGLFVAAILLITPGWITDLVGFSLFGGVYLSQVIRRRIALRRAAFGLRGGI